MLVKEIRNELNKYDRKDLEDIIIELYKRVPKKVKDAYYIDDFIKNKKNICKKEEKKLSFAELVDEIKWFLSCVDADYYCTSNNVITKDERSKWRFKVKKYYKELVNINANTDDGKLSTELLIELFKRLSCGTYILKFSNWDTFRAIGISQADLYLTIIKRVLSRGHSFENIYTCIDLLSVFKDSYSSNHEMYDVFINIVDDIDDINMGIEAIYNKNINLEKEAKECKNSTTKYYIEESIRLNAYVIFNLYLKKNEADKAVSEFNKIYIEKDREIKAYILLNLLKDHELYKEFIAQYEKNIGKIDYRESLIEDYKNIKKQMKL